MPHLPVLLQEILNAYKDRRLRYFADATLGAGGHSLALLQAHPEIECLIAFDQDPQAIEIAKKRLKDYHSKVLFICSNFHEIAKHCEKHQIPALDGILMDIGVSSMQIDQAQRGFSFLKEGPLDMRMDPQKEIDAKTVVNKFSEKDLSFIFKEYGEEKQHRLIAKLIVQRRKKNPFESTLDLSQAIHDLFATRKKIHPATRVFQALRIYVNEELDNLKKGLEQSIPLLCENGLLSVISFHSLEDRIVKETFRDAARQKMDLPEGSDDMIAKKPLLRLWNKKPLIASKEEAKQNPRSRSAKLRIAEKLL